MGMKEQLEDEIRKVEENGKNALAEHKKSIDRTLNNHEKKLAEIKSQGTPWHSELQKEIESFRAEIQAQMRKEMEMLVWIFYNYWILYNYNP